MLLRIIVLIIVVIFSPYSLSADVHSWIDENGIRRFSNSPPDDNVKEHKTTKEIEYIPPPENSVQEKKQVKPKPLKKINKRHLKSNKKKKTSKNPAFKKGPVVMYMKKRCGYCIMAKKFFNKHNISFTEYNIDESKNALAKYRALKGRGVPLIFVGNQRINGFDKKTLKKLLGIK